MKRIGSRTIYEGRLLSLREDRLRSAEGTDLTRVVVAHPGAVVVIAVLEGDLLFVKQYRYAADEELLELVAGTLEPGEDPGETAQRELQEEAGYKAGRMQKLGEFYSAPGFCNELLHLYLADELTPSRLPGDADELIELIRLPVAAALEMALNGQLRDAKSIAGVLLYAVRSGAR
jgi:ADP-ribose pyrophosphatase